MSGGRLEEAKVTVTGARRSAFALAAVVLGASGCEEPSVSFHQSEAGSWKMIVPPGLDQGTILRAARARCGRTAICQVTAYTDKVYLRPGVPEEERWRAAVFDYSRNSDSGFEHVVWDCSIYRDTDRSRCRGEPIVDPELPEGPGAAPAAPAG